MNWNLSEVIACTIYVLLWAFILGALVILCKDGIISLYRKFQSWRRYRGYQKEWDYQDQEMFEEITDGRLHNGGGEMNDANNPTDEEIEEQYRLYLLNKDCLLKGKNGPITRTLCNSCIMTAADNGVFIKAIKMESTEPCFHCGHVSGEEFPDSKEEQ